MNMGDRIGQRLKELGWEQADLRRRVPGMKKGTLSALVNRNSIRSVWSEPIARALGVRHQWLVSGTGPKHEPEADGSGNSDSRTISISDTVFNRMNSGRSLLARVTVTGTARMDEYGFFEEIAHPAGEVDGHVSGDPGVYALRIKGDAMHPVIRHGQFIIVEPGARCEVGEYVALTMRDGRRAVRELVRETDDEVVIEAVTGGGRTTIDRSDIAAMHAIVCVSQPSRWRPATS